MRPMICALCGKKQEEQELYPATFDETSLTRDIYSARRIPDRIHYRLVRCNRCGLIFSNPILQPNIISKLYRESVCNYGELLRYTTRTYIDIFNLIRNRLPKYPKVLEVGCGNGFFLDALKKTGVREVFGVEPGQDMVKSAPKYLRKRITVDIFKKGQFAPNSFDVVACFHTLDHMVDPKTFVQSTFEVLKPGGYVLIVVHDTGGMSVKLFGENSPIFDIEHIYLFNKKNITQLFSSCGFTNPQAFDIANTYPLSYWLQMSGLPGIFKSTAQWIIRTTGLSSRPLTLSGGNLAFIGRKPE